MTSSSEKRPYAFMPSTGRESDVKDFFKVVQLKSMHKNSHSKPMFTPVFESWAQRKQFYDLALAEKTKLEAQVKVKGMRKEKRKQTRRELDATTHLVNASWGGVFGSGLGSTAKTSFAGLKSPRVYVWGHGTPGGDKLGGERGFESIATSLQKMRLPNTSDVRVDSCWSGVGPDFTKTHSKDVLSAAFHRNSLEPLADKTRSFAAKLHSKLKEGGFEGTTTGYLGATSFGAIRVEQAGLSDKGTHFAATLAPGLDVRRSQAKITFK
ncbi:hypothetical protein [Chitiniphilus shinanonensis]|uniref:hypothetical protein n=1 Tax=Chitiniphilus shinanonensis TaxID=553088 RepID=UPI003022570E